MIRHAGNTTVCFAARSPRLLIVGPILFSHGICQNHSKTIAIKGCVLQVDCV
jgi:hypothetical protein